LIGTVLCKRYRIMEEIGHGGMGVVYRAWDESLQTNVALKVLLPVDLKDPSARDRFKRGALLPAPIDHPNVCSVRHFDTCDGVDCLVMDYIAGTPLEERIAAGLRPLAVDPELLQVARQHSTDMFARGYFAHVTPEGHDPFERMREAMATPMADSAKASTKTSGMTVRTLIRVSFTPTTGARSSRIRPWNMACVAPPSAFPMATADRSMGATRTSLRNPNSRSHTMLMAAKMLLKSTDMPMIPGKMNCV